jgi:hypothetical protein
VAVLKIPVKRRCQYIEKEFSITVLGDLFNGISFLRFLEHFWNRWNTGTRWNMFHSTLIEANSGQIKTLSIADSS